MPTRAHALAASLLASLALAGLAACGSKPDAAAQAAATPRDVTLTPAQLQHIGLVTVTAQDFHKTIEAAGVVDFDNDQSTSVVSPISGLVTRLLVQPGQPVAAGQALAMVDSSDFAAATSAYAKAVATARTTRQLADADKDLAQHNGISAREAQQAETDAVNAAADRDAALKALQALKLDPRAIADIQAGRPVSRIEAAIRAPIAGTVVEKLITPGQLLQAGTTPAFTVANLSKVWVMAQVPTSDLPSVSAGDPALVETGIGAASVNGVVDNVAAPSLPVPPRDANKVTVNRSPISGSMAAPMMTWACSHCRLICSITRVTSDIVRSWPAAMHTRTAPASAKAWPPSSNGCAMRRSTTSRPRLSPRASAVTNALSV